MSDENKITEYTENIKDNGIIKAKDIIFRPMEIGDYDNVFALWKTIKGFGIQSLNDSREGTERFLERNPGLSMVAQYGGRIIGDVLCGHDGRRGCFYHVCVAEEFRRMNIGRTLVTLSMRALKDESIHKINLIAFTRNEVGNNFWKGVGWSCRSDVNYYEFVLNEKNITKFNE